MPNFLNDNSNLAAAGSAFQGFTEGLEKAQDRKMKNMEFQAQMEAVKTKAEREKAQTAIDAYKAKIIYDPSKDSVSDRPLSDREQYEEDQKMFNSGGMKDQSTGKIIFNPNSTKAKEIEASKYKADRSYDASVNKTEATGQRQSVKNELQANKQYSVEMGKTEQQIMGASKALSLIEGIKSGKLKSTPQLRSDLSAALGSLINQGQPATVYSMSHQDFDSLYGRAQATSQFLTGNTVDSMTPSQLDQLDKDIRAINHELGVQHETKYQSFKEGIPDQFSPKLDKRYSKFRSGTGLDRDDQPLSAPPPGPQGGLVKPQGGFLSRMAGLIMGPSADAAGPQVEPDVAAYAKAHKISVEQAQAIKRQRTGQ